MFWYFIGVFIINRTLHGRLVCYTAVFSVVMQSSSPRDDSKNGCVAD